MSLLSLKKTSSRKPTQNGHKKAAHAESFFSPEIPIKKRNKSTAMIK